MKTLFNSLLLPFNFKLWSCLLTLTFNHSALTIAQNLVPNPSFEEYDTCPDAFTQIYHATAWSSFGDSPDYFNKCSSSNIVSIPLNLAGFQFPDNVECAAYIGLLTWGGLNYREFAGAELTSSLEIGKKYYISFKTCLAEFSTCATNNLGITFSTIPYSQSNPIIINNSPHFYSSDIITDTTNWTIITGEFIADSTYKYISIGNFFNDSLTNRIIFTTGNAAYYFLDDICVSTDSTICNPFNYNCGTGISEKYNRQNKVKIYPNPARNILHFKREMPFNTLKKLCIINYQGIIIKTVYSLHDNYIDVKDLKKGIYLLLIYSDNQTYANKFIIN